MPLHVKCDSNKKRPVFSVHPPPLSPQIEHSLLRESFAALARQMDLIFKKKLWYIRLEQFFMKYMWGLSGECIGKKDVCSCVCACNGGRKGDRL